ncbi:LOW QUALITY PROTEIN: galectin-4 [Anolis sagrei]|uniref:LOW QUALITY PROTEIN: galectin-4 n=2 Tax=Anolis sagrei TaxID=38937 RepID=UPI003520DFDF
MPAYIPRAIKAPSQIFLAFPPASLLDPTKKHNHRNTMSYVPAPGYMPAFNPVLPYNQPVPGGLRPGMSIYVQGKVPHHTKRFRVNFACAPHEGADIALHFNPRFDGKDKVVLNTFHGGKWGKEEHQSMPLHKDQHFEIVFIVNNSGYQILVNRNPFCNYNHRIPPERVQVVSADGDLELQSVTVLGGGMMGGGGMPHQPMAIPGMAPGYPPSNLPMMSNPASYHPQVPYVGNLPGGLGPKKTIVVRGFIPQDAKRFRINFKAGQEIALHINPRLDERVVVRNSFLGGRWGQEEREISVNPFQRGQYFDLSIRCGNQQFKIFIDGQPLFNYKHRFHNFQQINTLEIDGDVMLSYVQS